MFMNIFKMVFFISNLLELEVGKLGGIFDINIGRL